MLRPEQLSVTRRTAVAGAALGCAMATKWNAVPLAVLPDELAALVAPALAGPPDELGEPGDPPVLAVRVQQVFGLTETPSVAGGRVPVTFKLLSPARRPVQVTRDLESFWKRGYAEVRKDLRGRYPKHHWPDDPLTAEPVRGVRRRPRGATRRGRTARSERRRRGDRDGGRGGGRADLVAGQRGRTRRCATGEAVSTRRGDRTSGHRHGTAR